MNQYIIILLIIALLYSPWTRATDLLGVYELAQQQDSAVRRERELLGATKESKPQAEARLLPVIGLSANAQYLDTELGKSNYRISGDQYVQRDLSIQLSQPIYHADYWIRLYQTEDAIAQAEAKLAGVELELMVRTAKAYFTVLTAADDVRTADAEKGANALQLTQAKKRFELGSIAITDVHEAQAAYDEALAKEITAQNYLSNAWESLREIIGEINQPIATLGETLPLQPPLPDNIEQWADTALQNNYDIRVAQKAVEQAKKNIDLQHAGYSPTVDLVVSYGVYDSDSEIGNNRNTGEIGLKLSVPLYQGGAVDSKERQAGYEYRAAQEALDQQRKSTDRKVREAYRGILSSIGQVAAFQSAVVSSQTAMRATQAGMEVGSRTIVDVLVTIKNLYEAQRNYSRARYQYIINGLLLQYFAGTLTKETIEEANSWLVQEKTLSPR